MSDKKHTVLQPAYLSKFHCIGSACEDSCCIGWRVDLDKKTYLTYQKLREGTLTPLISKHVNRKHSEKSDGSYGKINMLKNGRCPFLNDENLCQVYVKAGEDALSDTCTFYPRTVRKIDGKLERCATMSCPEAARLALLDPAGIVLESVSEDAESRFKIHHAFETQGHAMANKAQRYFWDIRLFSLTLLQDRAYTLAERLILLGIVYQKMDALQQENRMKDLPNMLAAMENMIHNGAFKEQLATVPAVSQVQMRLAKELTDTKVLQGITSQRYLECLQETLQGLDYVPGSTIETTLEKYEAHYKKYLTPYLAEKEYIVENYLVNEYIKEMMPFGTGKSLWDSYILLSVLFAMVKLHLVGMAGHHQGLTDELTIKLIQSFSKVVLHNKAYIQGIISTLKSSGYDSLAYMAILAKN